MQTPLALIALGVPARASMSVVQGQGRTKVPGGLLQHGPKGVGVVFGVIKGTSAVAPKADIQRTLVSAQQPNIHSNHGQRSELALADRQPGWSDGNEHPFSYEAGG